MSNFDKALDDLTMSVLILEEEDAKAFRIAVMDLIYEDLFKPLWQRHEEFVKTTKRTYKAIIVLQVVLVALLLMNWLW